MNAKTRYARRRLWRRVAAHGSAIGRATLLLLTVIAAAVIVTAYTLEILK